MSSALIHLRLLAIAETPTSVESSVIDLKAAKSQPLCQTSAASIRQEDARGSSDVVSTGFPQVA